MHTEQDTGNTDDEHSKRLSGNSGELRALNELKGNFIIPGYQRGYRWNDQQINDFLNDIFEFYEQFKNGKESKIYFLQPIMVMERYSDGAGEEEKCPEINIVDGQQRLTTVFLLNAVLLNQYDERIQGKIDNSRCQSAKSDFIDYTLSINTRNKSTKFLKYIGKFIKRRKKYINNKKFIDRRNLHFNNIDLQFLYNAYMTIIEYIENIEKNINQKNREIINWSEFYRVFAKQVKVLWYVIDDSDSSGEIAAFTRLNSGKIPLTNAELSRAALLNPAYYKSQNSKDANENLPDIETERGLISVGWDNLEYELRKPEFWGFLGFSENDYSSNVKDRRNRSFEDERYQTRIDFLLDFHFNKKSDEDNKLASFMALEKELKNAEAEKFAQKNVKQIWESIQLDLWKLQTWYDDNDLYHWIGYLFAEKQMNQYLFSDFKELEKDKLKEEVKGNIKSFYPDLETVLEYTYETDRAGCERALFLYNVEYVRSMKTTGKKPRYDFSAHHQKKWSIEHIKAQNVEGLNTKEQWLIWLEGHLEVVASISPRGEDRKKDDLKKDGSRKEDNLQSDNLRRKDDLQPLSKHVEELMDKLKSSELFEYSEPFKLPDTKEEFLRLSKRILEFFDDRTGPTEVIDNRLHELSNLALLDRTANSALNNSIFRVKQNKIVEEMKQGNFIPPATQAVFLRLFSMEEQGHLYWTAKDRKAYQDDIKEKLEYLLG